ncbi:hypothetical protein PSPO_a0132 [Pseudoalteromonas spongiae UST010723-006]|nr:hypothetical protein PSPO_a0132 [Pseudoalteromonas spongiae UST010723-006]
MNFTFSCLQLEQSTFKKSTTPLRMLKMKKTRVTIYAGFSMLMH